MDSEIQSFVTSSSEDVREDPITKLPDEELYNVLDDLLRANEVIKAENEMFQRFLSKTDVLQQQQQLLQHQSGGGGGPSSSSMPASLTSSHSELPRMGGGRGRGKRSSSAAQNLLKLTAEQKCEIAQAQIDEVEAEAKKARDDIDKMANAYAAILEEADIRLGELTKSEHDFEKDIIKGSVNPRTKKILAEKLQRYFEDQIKSKESNTEKLRLKLGSLKNQRKKLLVQLKQKEEMGEVLQEVDFQQLKIENSQYLEKIDEKNQELLRLKLMLGNTTQVLNSYKKKLSVLTSEATRLSSEMQLRNDLIRRNESETQQVMEEKEKAEGINHKLREQLSDYKVPAVMEYVNNVSDLYELKKKEKIWDRKVDIAKMAVTRHKKLWQQIRRGSMGADV